MHKVSTIGKIKGRCAVAVLAAFCASASAVAALPVGVAEEGEATLRGVVRNVSMQQDGYVVFDVAHSNIAFTVVFEDSSMIAPVDFEDALIDVTGTCIRDAAGGVRIHAVDVTSVNVISPPPEDPFALPVVILPLEGSSPFVDLLRRIHTRGVVAQARQSDAAFIIHTAAGALVRVVPEARKAALPKIGDLVEVCAFLTDEGGEERLEDALVRIVGHDKSKLPPYWTAGRVWTLMGIVVASLVIFGVAMLLVMRRIERERYTATLRERLRLSHDLHDNLQQLLAATMFRLDAAQSFFDFDLKSAREQLGWAKKAVESTQAGLRSVLWDLHEESEGPESLTGLVRYAVGRMAHWSGKVAVEVVGSEPDGVRRHGGRFLMIIQEAVGNALSRGGATNVRVRLFFRPGLVRLVVTDNGCGFVVGTEKGARDGHLGISSMRLRAAEIGGVFSIRSEPGKGTSVIVEVDS